MADWKSVEEIFVAAAELPACGRAAFLDAACAGDATLRREVESLLRHDAENSRPFAAMVGESAAVLLRGESYTGRRLGPWQITESLGQGGMGAVFLAVRADEQFTKKVAIKFIRRGMDTPEAVGSFLRERQILANLDHPAIAKLLDGGTTEDGVPYFVMEYVAGTPVDVYCDRHELNTAQRCELFRRICDAVAYAHRNLVVHRDLKPANILVGESGDPMLLDFGIAKLIDESAASSLTHTSGAWALTPDYASPEQILGRPTTTASDVYSLGIVLYRLLTGVKPYTIESTNPVDMERTICQQQPERPSLAGKNRRLAGDLDNIILMALRKEPERRYTSVEQFSEDVRRYLRGLPVMAREDTFGYRARKFVHRNRVGVLAGSLAAASLLAAVVMTSHEARRAEQARQAAENARGVAVAERWRAEEQRSRAEREHRTADRERDVASEASQVAGLRAREAEAEKQKAQQRLSDLVSLANQSLFDVQGVLERVPNTLEARRDVIASTLQYLDGLAAETKDDPEVLAVLVSGYTQSGDVLGYPAAPNLGNRAGAVEAWNKGRAILARLEKVQPDNMRPRLQDLGLHQRIGMVLETEGNLPGAIAEYKTALAAAEKLAADYPSNGAVVSQIGIMGHSLAAALAQVDPADADPRIRVAIDAWEKANILQPDGQFHQGLAAAVGLLGNILVGEGRPEEGLKEYRRSLDIRMKMLAAHPNDIFTTSGIAKLYMRMAATFNAPWQANVGDPAGAMEAMGKSLAFYESQVGQDPANRKAQADLATALVWAGAMDGDTAEALTRLRRAVVMLNDLRSADPKQVSYRSDLAMAHEYLGHRLRDRGDLNGAVAEYRLSLAAQENPALAAKVAEYESQMLRAASR